MHYFDLLNKKPFFVLAPMDDVTDTVFRQTIQACAPPDLMYTEFVNVDGLSSPGRPRLLKKLLFVPNETRLVAQVWGLKPENFFKVAEQIADGTFSREMGLPDNCNFVGLDLNMGCPAKSEVQNGACSALIKNRPLAHEIIEAARAGLAGRMPLSVKTRVGFNEVDMSWIKYLLDHELDMLVVHGRTRKQMSKVPADWNLIGQARQIRDDLGIDTLIVGNGDVQNYAHGLQLATKYGLDGVMIGRGIFQDPYSFAPRSPWQYTSPQERVQLFKSHVALFAATWRQRERPIHTLNKFCKIYVNGFEGSKEMREQLMAAQDAENLLGMLEEIEDNLFTNMKPYQTT